MRAPFPYFGGKSSISDVIWRRFGTVRHYIEPFCGSAAVLLSAPVPASLEVVNDANGFIANFWRAVKYQPESVAEWADYPVSHVDLGARHGWLMRQVAELGAELQDPDWPGDPKVAGWWVWGQCCWIGSGWCSGQIPHVSNAGRGVQAIGQIPHVSNAGHGFQAIGQIPHVSDAGRAASRMLAELSARLDRVRVLHGTWDRCLNNHYGAEKTAVFLDPPYRTSGEVYDGFGAVDHGEIESWCREHSELRIALCGQRGDYSLPGWTVAEWSRGRFTYNGASTTELESIWFSPACVDPLPLFEGMA